MNPVLNMDALKEHGLTLPAKPPAQVLGVAGIEAAPIIIHDAKINWATVAALPPFQMYLAERDGPNQTGKNAQEWATQVATHLAATTSDTALFEAYCAWHTAKGYWPNETPLGEVKES